ncbi:MAG: suppressor of fused domain protein [Massilia sp.]
MQRLHHYLVEHRWGEPSTIQIYDRSKTVSRAPLRFHVVAWNADEECDVTTFMTVGMSELLMPQSDYRVEMTLAVRGELTQDQRIGLADFLANLAEYPVMYDRRLDWWERLINPGVIPAFPACSQILIAPPFGDDPFERFPSPDDDVKLLWMIPITAREGHILKTQGRSAFLDYWEAEGVDIFSPRSDTPAGIE